MLNKKITFIALIFCFALCIGQVLHAAAHDNNDNIQQAYNKLTRDLDEAQEQLISANTDVVLNNPTVWPVEILYAQHNIVHKVNLPAGSQLNLGPSNQLHAVIGIKTLPATAVKDTWWYTATSFLYGQDFTPINLNEQFQGKTFQADQHALVSLVGTQATWDVTIDADKTAERKAGLALIDAFKRYAEMNPSFDYEQRFEQTLPGRFVVTNESYWPIDVIFFKNGKAYKCTLRSNQIGYASSNINPFIAVKAHPLTTQWVAGTFGVSYQYHLFNLENMHDQWQAGTIYQLNIATTGTAQDWDMNIDTLEHIPAGSQVPLTPISIDWPTSLGWSKDTYIAIGSQLNKALLEHNRPELTRLQAQFDEAFGQEAEQNKVKALILYYHALARTMGHIFQEGTFIIHDAKPIYDFLTSLQNAYRRNSSHLNALARYHSKPWLAQTGQHHWGYDVPLPEIGFSTILFNRITQDGNVFYLKPESHGTAGIVEAIGHGISFAQAQGRKLLPMIFGSDDQPAYSKERIPKDILARYIAHIETLNLSEERKEQLAQDAVSKGIQAMYMSAQRLIEEQKDGDLRQFINGLEKPDVKMTYPEKRFGSEVILTPKEFDSEPTGGHANNQNDTQQAATSSTQ